MPFPIAALMPLITQMIGSKMKKSSEGGDDDGGKKKKKKGGGMKSFLFGKEGMVIGKQNGPRNLLKEYTKKVDDSKIPEHMMDFYSAGLERMKELYEGDKNHEYHKIIYDSEGNYIKDRKRKSDTEQNLSFESWLKTPTGKSHLEMLVGNYDDKWNSKSEESVTKTKRSGKTVTLGRGMTPKEKDNYIKNIMSSDEPTRMWGPPEPRYTKTVTKPKYDWERTKEDKEIVSHTAEVEPTVKKKPIKSRPGKMARWIKKSDEKLAKAEARKSPAAPAKEATEEDVPKALFGLFSPHRRLKRKMRRGRKGKGPMAGLLDKGGMMPDVSCPSAPGDRKYKRKGRRRRRRSQLRRRRGC